MLTQKHLHPGFRGAIAKTVVVKQYNNKTVLTSYPDMSRVVPSARQKQQRSVFAEAVAYARNINNNLHLKECYAAMLPAGSSVYHATLREYLLQLRPGE